MIALYHQIKIPISFLCRQGLNPISLIQPSEILLIKLTETHILLPLLIIRVLYIYSSPKLYTLFQVLTKKPLANTIRFTYYLSLSTIPINYYVTFLSFLEFNSWTLKKKKKPILHIYFFFPIFFKVTHFSFIVEHPFILKKNKAYTIWVGELSIVKRCIS